MCNMPAGKSSRLIKLDPFLKSNAVLKLKGSQQTNHQVHLIAFLKTGKITEAIVKWNHKRVAECGKGVALNNLQDIGILVISTNCDCDMSKALHKI